MDNTEKKLDALINALGFEMEEVRGKPLDMHTEKGFLPGRWAIDYKVTKKDSGPPSASDFTRGINPIEFDECIL